MEISGQRKKGTGDTVSRDPVAAFENEKKADIDAMIRNQQLNSISKQWLVESYRYKYSYHFSWMGRPIIQYPQDIIALQELIWEVKPELVIETGIAHGGSLVFYASMLELLGGEGRVIGIDTDIREHNRIKIENHPMKKRITLLEGSSTDQTILEQVKHSAANKKPVFVVLDSNHSHDHVSKELEIYSPLVTVGSYLVVLDTLIEDMPDDFYPERPWGKGNSPKTAVEQFLKTCDRFEINPIENKLLLTAAGSGYLRCIK